MSCMGKRVASVLLKLFIDVYDRCHTIDVPTRMAITVKSFIANSLDQDSIRLLQNLDDTSVSSVNKEMNLTTKVHK